MNMFNNELALQSQLTKKEMTEYKYFPTLVYKFKVPNALTLNEKLKSAIYLEKEKDKKGIQRSNFKKLGGWHSHNNLHKEKNFSELTQHIEQASALLSENLGYHQSYAFKIGTMWSIINPPGSCNRSHVHPNCDLSGVYYIQGPKDSGNIEFTDPRTITVMKPIKYIPNKQRPKQCWTKVKFAPTPGTLFIFPSWLYHSVGVNASEEKVPDSNRIIISFNLNQKKIID